MKATLLILFSVLFFDTVSAQKLPTTSRTVYKCEDGGKVHYSDAPCLGAKKIDVEPTRGLDKSSGSTRTGSDVVREKHREIFADAVRPLTGMDSKQLETAGRRQSLTSTAQKDCKWLDGEILVAEQAEANVPQGVARQSAQERLLGLRSSYHSTGC